MYSELKRALNHVVYYESLKRALKTKTIYGYRCDERLKTNVEESTRLGYTPLCVVIIKSLFILNHKSESYRQKLYMDIGVMKG